MESTIRRGEAASVGDLGHLRLDGLASFIIFNLLLFQPYLEVRFGSPFSYVDEIAVLALIMLSAASSVAARTNRLLKGQKRAYAMLLAAVVLGVFGNLVGESQQSFTRVAVDVFASVKVFVMLGSALYLFTDGRVLASVRGLFIVEARALAWILGICAISSLFVDIGMSSGRERYGLSPFRFIFPHPESVNFAAIGILSIILADNPRSKLAYLPLIAMILTLRTKAFVAVAIVVLLLITLGEEIQRLRGYHVVGSVLAIALLGWDQFKGVYAGSDGSVQARDQMLRVSVLLASDKFPFGAGFGMFGSAVSADGDYYSPIYYEYGLNRVYGLSPDFPNFISDTFWPTVIGQLGWIGLVLVAGAIWLCYRSVYEIAIRKRFATLPVLCCMAYMLIASVAESVFFSPMGVFLSLCIGIVVGITDSAHPEVDL